MVNSVNKYSRGRTGVLEYLLNMERVQNGTAFILRGDADFTASLIKQSKHMHKYLSGGLYFGDDVPSEQQERDIMDAFEAMIFAGMDKSQYNILWVKHVDKGVVELNYVIPRVELTTGKSLSLFSFKRDLPLWNMWKNGINAKYKFISNPNDDARVRTPSQKAHAQLKNENNYTADGSFLTARAELDEELNDLTVIGKLKSRDEIYAHLEKQGYKVTRKTRKDFFYVTHPTLGDKAVKMQGRLIYTNKFDADCSILEDMPKREVKKTDIYEPTIYQKYLKTREERHLKHYKMPTKPTPKPNKKDENDTVREEDTRVRNEAERRDRVSAERRRRKSKRASRVGEVFGWSTADDGHGEPEHEVHLGRVAKRIAEAKESKRSGDIDKEIIREIGSRTESIGQEFGRSFDQIILAFKEAKKRCDELEEVLAAHGLIEEEELPEESFDDYIEGYVNELENSGKLEPLIEEVEPIDAPVQVDEKEVEAPAPRVDDLPSP